MEAGNSVYQLKGFQPGTIIGIETEYRNSDGQKEGKRVNNGTADCDADSPSGIWQAKFYHDNNDKFR